MSQAEQYEGGCLCGGVRFRVAGPPLRVGLCHCGDCRKSTGSVYSAYAIWPRTSYAQTGAASVYAGRSFCPTCGSRVSAFSADEAEVMIGSLDQAPGPFVPQYELWVHRRERWLHPLPGARQFDKDRE